MRHAIVVEPVGRFVRVAAILLVFCLSAAISGDAQNALSGRQLRDVESMVAVDNVCAWPSLVRMPDGTIVAALHNQPDHGLREADVVCYASTDGGRKWEFRGTPAPHDTDTIRMNHAFGLAHDGSLVLLCSGWGGKAFREYTLPVMVSRSADGGRTWTRSGTVEKSGNMPDLIPYGPIVQLNGDVLAVNMYDGTSTPDYNRAYVFFSDDDGLTWRNPVIIGESGVFNNPSAGNYNETAILFTGRKTLIAAARTFTRQARLDLLASDDRGRTWQIHESRAGSGLTGPSEHPGHLLQLRDGRILLTYGIRHDAHGIGARVSGDGGLTWGEPFTVIAYGGNDGGYPSSVELDDGVILTAYYSDANRLHSRYHMGVVRWKIPR